MATFMKHTYVPLELIDEICGYAEISAQICLMHTSRQMHAALLSNVYRRVSVRGLQARRFFGTVTSGFPNAQLYASAIRQLTYRGYSVDDALITFPLFVNALLKMYRLHTLAITVGKSVAGFLVVQLNKTGINRHCQSLSVALDPLKRMEASIWALPCLKSLMIHGDHALTSLARCRNLTVLRLGQPISMTEFSAVLLNLVDGKGDVNHHIKTLEINLHNVTCAETGSALIGIAKIVPSLYELTFRVPHLNPLMVIDMMVDTSVYLHQLRAIFINTADEEDHYFVNHPHYASPEDECKLFFIKSLKKAAELRPWLYHVQFGWQEWSRLKTLHRWESKHLAAVHVDRPYRATRVLNIVYSMKGGSKKWGWMQGFQDNLAALLKISKA